MHPGSLIQGKMGLEEALSASFRSPHGYEVVRRACITGWLFTLGNGRELHLWGPRFQNNPAERFCPESAHQRGYCLHMVYIQQSLKMC